MDSLPIHVLTDIQARKIVDHMSAFEAVILGGRVDGTDIRVPGMKFPFVPTRHHTKVDCRFCDSQIWIGPSSLDISRMTGNHPMCTLCFAAGRSLLGETVRIRLQYAGHQTPPDLRQP